MTKTRSRGTKISPSPHKQLRAESPVIEGTVKKLKTKKPTIVQSLKDLFVFPRYDYAKNRSVILACDPGIKNFAYVLLESPDTLQAKTVTPETLVTFLKDIKILDCGFLKSCLAELRQENVIPYFHRFKRDNAEIFSCSPDYLIMERYQSRDLRGPRNEVINFNICNVIHNLLDSNHPIRNTRLLIAAQWKRYFNLDKTNKVKGLDLMYDTWKKDKQLKRTNGLTDHQTDAFSIGIYHILDTLLSEVKDRPDLREAAVTYLIANTANYFRTYFKEQKHD